jgi:phage FluMu protein Com
MALPVPNIPKYNLVVPSTGKSITYRPYLVGEEKILMIAMESQNQIDLLRAVKDVIEKCTFGAIKSKTLTTFDLEYIFCKLRTKSSGETSSIIAKCNECKASNPITIDLDKEVKVKNVNKSKDGMHISLDDRIGINLKYPTIDNLSEHLHTDESEIEMTFAMLISCIDSIYDGDTIYASEEQTTEELQTFIESLGGTHFTKLQEFFSNIPTTYADIKFKCSECKKDNEFELTGLSSFFS